MSGSRCLQGELMDSQAGAVGGYSGAHALTDLTLSLLQDSGWCAVVLFYPVVLGCDFVSLLATRASTMVLNAT